MSKVEKFNFSKHLKEIVGNELKQHGFKVKGTRLIRSREDFTDEIYFQRSQFNAFNDNVFFLNLSISSPEGYSFATIRLDNSNQLNLPKFCAEYFSATGELPKFDNVKFNKEEEFEFRQWYKSKYWKYSNEEELIKLLKDAKDLLLTKGFYYFEKATKLLIGKSEIDHDLRLTIYAIGTELNKYY